MITLNIWLYILKNTNILFFPTRASVKYFSYVLGGTFFVEAKFPFLHFFFHFLLKSFILFSFVLYTVKKID